ncbi:MAG: hypothetical protein MJ105_08420 [Lachnospiraceae bacterium]|nr:hypothetical protein [Lachnospiraceae bacterium]
MMYKEDTTFHDLRARSVEDWLSEMENHEDLAVRGGVKVTKDYIMALQKKIDMLEEKNTLKDQYLKKISKG